MSNLKKQEPSDNLPLEGDNSTADPKMADEKTEKAMPSPQQEADVIKKKYGGIIPKKPPLISKDHERAYFDSADWALGKQGAQKPKGPLEALRPKLQPSAHHQARSRHSAYAPSDGEDDDGNDASTPQDQSAEEHDPSKEGGIVQDTVNNNSAAAGGPSSHN